MPKTLLLADDSVVIQKLVALSFANEDVDLITVYNGDEAVAKASESRPDLVLADVVMPGKNGYDVCEAIKQDPELAHVPVLLLTGTFEAFDEDRARQVGSDGQITKPFEATALVERVNDLLSRTTAPAPAPATPAPGVAPAAQAAPPSLPAAGVQSGDTTNEEVYDFFDDDLSEPLAAAEPAAPSSGNDSFAFGIDDGPALSPLPADDPLAGIASGAETPDHTVALMPDEVPAATAADVAEAPTVTASGFTQTLPTAPAPSAPEDSFGSSVTAPETAPPTIVSDDAFASAAPLPPPEPAATVIADDVFAATPSPEPVEAPAAAEDLAFGDTAPTPAAPQATTVLADELFGEPTTTSSDDLELGFVTAPPTSVEPPLELDMSNEPAEPLPQAELDPAGSSAFDVSSSDLGSPLAGTTPLEPSTSLEPEGGLEPLEFAGAVPSAAEQTPPPLPTAPAALDAELRSPEPVAMLDSEPAGATPAAPSGLLEADPEPLAETPIPSPPVAPASPDLSDLMRERVHETLEKIAWEAFSDLSDSIVRQVLERVERIAWEVIPQMAETLVQEEIRKMKGESQD